MGDIVVNLSNEDNWSLVYNETRAAGRRGDGAFYPMQPFDIPILVEAPLLIAIAENVDARPWWWLGCRLQQRVQTGIAPGEVLGSVYRVPVNRPSLVRFPRLTGQYSLRCEIPPWFDRVKIVIYEYVGVIGDSTEALLEESIDLVRVDLLRIETKINTLL